MTIEEAIRILDPDTSREALRDFDHDTGVSLVEEACRLAVDALKAKQMEWERNASSEKEVTSDGR